jgi:hypothetical protein
MMFEPPDPSGALSLKAAHGVISISFFRQLASLGNVFLCRL